jgi:very-short-patch-repair endonuclease
MPDHTDLAATQHGLVSRAQLRELGVDRWKVRRWLDSGRLQSVHPNVCAVAGAPVTEHREVLAKILETGLDACASHTTAAWLWGLSGYTSEPVHIVVNRQSRHHERLAWTVHQFTGLPAHHRRILEGVPVTSPALTMLHLAQVVSRSRLGRAIDNAWNLRIVSGQDLFELDAKLAIQGRNGIVALREAAQARGPEWVPPQSNIESRFMNLVDPLGHNGFARQVRIESTGWAARVDFLHRASRTIVEIQSERYHTALTDREADRVRRARLEQAGYRVVEVWDNELFHRPDEVVDRVLSTVYPAA